MGYERDEEAIERLRAKLMLSTTFRGIIAKSFEPQEIHHYHQLCFYSWGEVDRDYIRSIDS